MLAGLPCIEALQRAMLAPASCVLGYCCGVHGGLVHTWQRIPTLVRYSTFYNTTMWAALHLLDQCTRGMVVCVVCGGVNSNP